MGRGRNQEGTERYRVDFDAPAIVEEDFELWLAKDIPVIYTHQYPESQTGHTLEVDGKALGGSWWSDDILSSPFTIRIHGHDL
jgi:hypothetical protein